jgi:hypothetical protein
MFVRMLACSAVAVLGSAAFAQVARADFSLVSQDLTLNRQSASVSFSLTFNQAPNFTVGSDGDPVNSFQVEFDGAPSPGSTVPDDLTAVVRGDEISAANAIRIRTPTGNGGPGSGGWGPVVGTVPFSLAGDTIAFTVPTAELGWTGGVWGASVYSLADGNLTAQQSVSSIPAPPAFWAGLAGLTALAGYTAYGSVVRRRRAGAYFAG